MSVNIQCPSCGGMLKHFLVFTWKCEECDSIFTEAEIRAWCAL